MDEKERHNIIHVLDRAIDSFRKGDINNLKKLSNQTVHDATVYQDEYSISLAVLIYSLSKVNERDIHYGKFKGWKKFCDSCYSGLEIAKSKLIHNDLKGFSDALKKYLITLAKIDPRLRRHIQDVLKKARINKASRLYEHGLSIGRTAELLGINKFELMDYVGKTYIADVKENITMNAKKRLDFVRGLFT